MQSLLQTLPVARTVPYLLPTCYLTGGIWCNYCKAKVGTSSVLRPSQSALWTRNIPSPPLPVRATKRVTERGYGADIAGVSPGRLGSYGPGRVRGVGRGVCQAREGYKYQTSTPTIIQYSPSYTPPSHQFSYPPGNPPVSIMLTLDTKCNPARSPTRYPHSATHPIQNPLHANFP